MSQNFRLAMDISSFNTLLPLATITVLVVGTYYYYRNAFDYWRRKGLPSPRALPLMGNIGRILIDGDTAIRWVREYGKVFGAYDGLEPVLVVADPDIIQEICVKNFHIFPNHTNVGFNSKLARKFIFNANDDHWRNIRTILSPTFTSGKMRRMYKLIEQCADNLLEAFEERLKSNPVVNLKDLFGLYTMDAIASCCYGLRLASYKGEASLATVANRDDFVKLGMELLDFKVWRIILIFILHPSILRFFDISLLSNKTEWEFARRVKKIIKKRRQSGKNFDDYLQTLINAKSDIDTVDEKTPKNSTNGTPVGGHSASGDGKSIEGEQEGERLKLQRYKEKPLSEIEVLSGATFLLVVGLETTSTLLTHCIYALSFHAAIQEKLHQVIKSMAKYDDQGKATFDYESLTSCEYLDAVVSETLRKHQPAVAIDRVASEDYYLASYEIMIPKGMKVFLSLNSIMSDPDNWSEPETFNPDRFMPGQREGTKPYSYCPFGIGPRQCLGMRFALTEAKLALARLLLDYRFEPAPGTRYPGEPKFAAGLNNLKRPNVTVIKR